MDFKLTKEQEMLRRMYRDFCQNEVKPLAAEIDEQERFPWETVEQMGRLGMLGVYFPKKYGGGGIKPKTVTARRGKMHGFPYCGEFTVPPLSATYYKISEEKS